MPSLDGQAGGTHGMDRAATRPLTPLALGR
jgi:hypothetical protein